MQLAGLEIVDVGPDEYRAVLESIKPVHRVCLSELSKQGYENLIVRKSESGQWVTGIFAATHCLRLVMPKGTL